MIDDLHSHRACGKFLRDLLHTVKTEMLVVHQDTDSDEELTLQRSTSDSLLVPDQNRRRRSNSGVVFQKLGDIAIHQNPDDD
jgi:hypothetical protein